MDPVWYVAFGLLAAITVVNSLFLLAIFRQIGVLYEHIRSAPPGQSEGGLEPGAVRPLPSFEPVTAGAREVFSAPVTVLGYVQPRCASCKHLPADLRQGASVWSEEQLEAVLVTDADRASTDLYATNFLGDQGPPMYHSPGFGESMGIEGSPYVLVVERLDDESLRVLAAGVTSDYDELEALVQEGLDVHMALSHPVLDPKSGPSAMSVAMQGGGQSDHLVTPAQLIFARHQLKGMETE